MDTDMDTDLDTGMDTDMDRGHGHGYGIRRYSAVWITCDTSRHKFQQRYKLVAPLPNENYDMLILKNSYRYWDFSLNNVLAELEKSV
jgi:hypothetical protein